MGSASMDLSGKAAVVTGGSMGMGLAIAKRFVAQGAKVAICSNDEGSLQTALGAMDADERALAINGDVSSQSDMQRLVAAAIDSFGGIDVLVNAAGIQRYGTVVDTDEQVWDEVMAVNVKGVFLASKHAVPAMAKRGGGAIVNIASVQAFASQSNVAAYTASKGAILALTRAMALDHADQGIRVNCICPAAIDTPMLRWAADLWKGDNTAEATVDAWGAAHPLGRVGTADEIAAVANFLASDLSAFMTGADVKVDGGVLSKLGIILPE